MSYFLAAPVLPPKQAKVDSPAVEVSAPPQPQTSQQPPAAMTEPKTVIEALQQRAARYKELADKAKADDNSSKARRMDRAFKVGWPCVFCVKQNMS